MPTLSPLDPDWPRREAFDHYRDTVPCTYAVTVDVDVTALVAAVRSAGRKTYPAQIWALAAVVSRHRAFRMGVTDDGEPAAWDRLDPMFTVLNPDRGTFAGVWTPWDADFDAFHTQVTELLAEHRGATSMFPQGAPPPHVFDVSSLPWLRFTSFDLHVRHGWEHLLPIFTIGRHEERDGRVLMPLAVQVHHSAADGLDTGRLVGDLEELVADPSWVTR